VFFEHYLAYNKVGHCM